MRRRRRSWSVERGLRRRLLAVLFLLSTIHDPPSTIFSSLSAADWPGWRGPLRTGVAPNAELPAPLDAGSLKKIWQTPIAGGYSGLALADGRLITMARTGKTESIICFDAASGKKLWERNDPVEFEPHPVARAHGNGPKSTPAIAEGRVYALGIAGRFSCLDLKTGTLVWTHDSAAEYAAPVPLFGMTNSPLVDGPRVIAQIGGPKGGTIMAFERAGGRVAWKALSDRVSYSSLIAADLGGVHQIVGETGEHVVGLDAANGKLLWQAPFSVQYDESIPTPVVFQDLVVFTAVEEPIQALRIERRGDGFVPRAAWRNASQRGCYLTSPVVRRGFIYGLSDDGRMVCIAAETGKTVWTSSENIGQLATLIEVGDRLLALNEDGDLFVVRATPERYAQLAQLQLSESETWAAPALAGRRLFVRDKKQVNCFELAKREAAR